MNLRPSGDQRQAPADSKGPGPAQRALLISLCLAVGLICAMVWIVGGPHTPVAQAMPGNRSTFAQDELDASVIRVATTGEDIPECGTEEEPCRTVQYAVDKALPGDELRVAAGTYTGTNEYGGLSQMVRLAKTLTIRGGYTTSDWAVPDPQANPTVLNAEGTGRVIVISPTITVHLEGLRFAGGDATELGGGPAIALGGEPPIKDAGGGLYILTATVTISNSWIMSNTASSGTERPGCGGGLYTRGGSVTLVHNQIVSNTAGVNVLGFGGGIYVDRGSATIRRNKIVGNTAGLWDDGFGGGLYLYGGVPPEPLPRASLVDNTLQGNYASRTADGQGGALYANHCQVELADNLVQYNTGGTATEGKGGGLYIFFSEALLERNLVRYNIASRGDEGISGGVHFCTCGDVTLRNNTIFSNTASTTGNGYGGGVSFCKTTATLDRNAIISNTATFSTALEVRGWGGGVWTGDRASLSLSNDLIAGNHAKTQGSGLWFGVENDEHNDQGIRLQHVTIADNAGGIGHGVYVTHAVAFLTNTIVAGHVVGVFVASGGEGTLEATLWYDNDRNTAGRVETGDLNTYDLDPAFLDPDDWDYHIGPESPALDRGVGTEVHSDMDGERRPWLAPDLGADEIWPFSLSFQAYLPLILRQSSDE